MDAKSYYAALAASFDREFVSVPDDGVDELDYLLSARSAIVAVLSPEELAEFDANMANPTYDPALALDSF